MILTLIVFLEEFSKKVNFEESQQTGQQDQLPNMQR